MRARTLLLSPWWVASLASGAKSFGDHPLIGSERLNRIGLHVARVRAAHALAAARRRRLEHLVTAEDRAAYARDGFVQKRDFLPADAFARLRDATLAQAAPAREMAQGDTVTRRIAVDARFRAAVPEAAALLRHPDWRGLIRYVGSFDSEPLSYVQTILSHRRDAPPDPQTSLHADTFHPTVKAWLFLTDVAADEGAFCYVPGSHRATPERLAWERRMSLEACARDRLTSRGSFRIAAEELGSLGLPEPKLFAVPANTLVVADTHGFHARGPSLRPSTRVEYWAYGRRNPFLPWTGLDPATLPGVEPRRVPLMWAARDRLERLMGQPWRDVGAKRPADEAD